VPLLALAGVLILVLLGATGVVSIAIGGLLCFFPRLRYAAPFFMTVPLLTAIGGAFGSSLFYLLSEAISPDSLLEFCGILLGFPIGAVVGLVMGLGIAHAQAANPLQRTRFRIPD
jgi:hypothetical protein